MVSPSAGVSVTASPVSRMNWRSGSVVDTRTLRCFPSGLPVLAASWSSVSRRRSTASGATVAAGSSATTMSQVWMACSPTRIRASPVAPSSIPNIFRCSRACSSASRDSNRSRVARSARSASDAWACGSLAFQLSQIGMNSSRPGGSCPVSPASRNKPKISACDPRWESTWAIDHSLAYERRSSSARPRGSTLARKRSWECRSALIHGPGLGSMFFSVCSPAYLEEIHWAAYPGLRPCPEGTLHIVYPGP